MPTASVAGTVRRARSRVQRRGDEDRLHDGAHHDEPEDRE
jgi:hypothetical protein